MASRSFRRERGDLSGARVPAARSAAPSGWSRLTLEQQCGVSGARESALVTWMITAGHAQARPEFLARGYQRLGKVAAWVHCDFHRRFMQVAADVGFTPKVAELQWWAVAKVAAVAGVAPDKLTRAKFDTASRRADRRGRAHAARVRGGSR